MLRKDSRVKLILAFTAVQIACLAAGLAVHYRCVVSVIHRAAETTAIEQLAAATGDVLAALSRVAPAGGEDAAAPGQTLRRLLAAANPPPDVRWVVTDPDWNVVAVAGGAGGLDAAGTIAPRPSWEQLDQRGEAGSQTVSGILTLPGGPHAAVARRLAGGGGYVVAFRPVGETSLTASALLGSLPAASAVAWAWTSVLLVIATYLIVTPLADKLLQNRARAEMESLQYARSLVRTRDALVFGLAEAAEFHDPRIGRHVQRVSLYTHQLADALRDEPKFRGRINSSFVELVSIASALHDLGKIGIEDSILFKPGQLTPAERARVEQHSTIGSLLLRNIHRRLGSSDIVEMAEVIARSHHERWDGQGSPDGLAGDQIPLAARIVAAADVYEALASPRDYKPPFPHERCVELICQEAGRQFDPDVAAAFLRIENVFREINRKHGEQSLAGSPPAGDGAAGDPEEYAVGLVALEQTIAPGWEASPAPPGPP